MDFDLSDEQLAFEETARQFARAEWLPDDLPNQLSAPVLVGFDVTAIKRIFA